MGFEDRKKCQTQVKFQDEQRMGRIVSSSDFLS